MLSLIAKASRALATRQNRLSPPTRKLVFDAEDYLLLHLIRRPVSVNLDVDLREFDTKLFPGDRNTIATSDRDLYQS